MSLHNLQTQVHVGKDKKNDFGGYNYRTAEGILAATKAALPDGATIVVSDSLQELAGQIFVTATATVTFADGATHSAQGHAMHPLSKKGMDPSQITGSASSYARKVALGGLLALDDGSGDPDAAKKGYEPEPEPEFSSEEIRDRLKAAISKAENLDGLERIWKHPKTVEVFERMHPAHKGEVSKAYDEKAAKVFQAPPGDEEAA